MIGKSAWLVASVAGFTAWSLLFVACSDDDPIAPTPDAGDAGDASSTRDVVVADRTPPPPDAPPPDATGPDPVARGKYLVDHVALCAECHTPRSQTGALDMTKYLAGVECLIDIDPGDAGAGCLHSRNLTNHATGLMNRSAAEIKNMFQNGVRPNGEFVHPYMPYWLFRNMTDADADAIVAFLRTVPGQDHTVPPNQAPFDNVPAAATPLAPTDIPEPTTPSAAASRGRYLSAMAGVCIGCHTSRADNPKQLDLTKLFGGGEPYPAAAVGVPVPPFPEVIYSANLTPHATGLAGWTAQDIVKALKTGVDKEGNGICPPMPAGPMGGFGGLTDADALDIATYIVALPPVDHTTPNQCAIPPM